ncbi:hypothetical protein CBD41_03570 [bacterium TMED181]|nr:hypothetical protein [Planctomycetota bacterium]OUW45740.1 MAG: hypothetical protein CBD41_03570 [bacterium TMED181]
MSIEEKIQHFFKVSGRERKLILKELLKESLTRDHVLSLAPAIRDPSPRICARVTSLLARWELDEVFEEQLQGLKDGKQSLLRGQFRKISSRKDSVADQNEATDSSG